MKPGDIVTYSRPEPGEERLTFVVLEHRGDRVLIESRDFPNARIAPREVVAKSDVVLAKRRNIHDATMHLRAALERLNDFSQAHALDQPRVTRSLQLMGTAIHDIVRELDKLEDTTC
jgi:hypothetical protein